MSGEPSFRQVRPNSTQQHGLEFHGCGRGRSQVLGQLWVQAWLWRCLPTGGGRSIRSRSQVLGQPWAQALMYPHGCISAPSALPSVAALDVNCAMHDVVCNFFQMLDNYIHPLVFALPSNGAYT